VTHAEGTAQRTATHCNATHCNALQRTATHCNALQRTATHCNALQRNALQRTATHCNALQRTATHFADATSVYGTQHLDATVKAVRVNHGIQQGSLGPIAT
jgi:hypothetical protein